MLTPAGNVKVRSVKCRPISDNIKPATVVAGYVAAHTFSVIAHWRPVPRRHNNIVARDLTP